MTGYINKSKTNCWGTPDHIMDKYKDYYDPCPFPRPEGYDGLKIDWLQQQKVYVNPPYSNIKEWAKKCYDTFKEAQEKNVNLDIVMLIPARTDTKYFHDYIYKIADIEFLKGRLKFKDLTGVSKKPTSAPFPSMICKYSYVKKNPFPYVLV